MKKPLRWAAALALVTLLWACAGPQSRPTPDVIVHASWAMSYGTLGDLAQDADAVVVGTVSDLSYDGRDPQDPTLPLRLYDIHVDRVIAGEAPGDIVVSQTGGTLDGKKYIVEGDPLIAAGDRVVLYLQRVDSGPSKGHYFILGGPQGRLAIGADDVVTRVGDSSVAIADGLTVADLVESGGR